MTSVPAEHVAQMLERDAFSRWLGITIAECRSGRCVAAMQVRGDMVNGFGIAHGAVAYALADSAMAFACNAGEHVTVAVDNAITYPMPVRPGDELIATALEESTSGRLSFYSARVTRRGDVVALFRGTVYRTSRTHHEAPRE